MATVNDMSQFSHTPIGELDAGSSLVAQFRTFFQRRVLSEKNNVLMKTRHPIWEGSAEGCRARDMARDMARKSGKIKRHCLEGAPHGCRELLAPGLLDPLGLPGRRERSPGAQPLLAGTGGVSASRRMERSASRLA